MFGFSLGSTKKSLYDPAVVGHFKITGTNQPKINKSTGKPKALPRFLRTVKNNNYNPTNQCEIVSNTGEVKNYFVNGVKTPGSVTVKCENYEGANFDKIYQGGKKKRTTKKKTSTTKKRTTKKKSTTKKRTTKK